VGIFFFWFENSITLSVILTLRHLEAELSMLRCLKLIRGVISTLTFKKKKNPTNFVSAWRKPWLACTTGTPLEYPWKRHWAGVRGTHQISQVAHSHDDFKINRCHLLPCHLKI
jgi:hypothetical protein